MAEEEPPALMRSAQHLRGPHLGGHWAGTSTDCVSTSVLCARMYAGAWLAGLSVVLSAQGVPAAVYFVAPRADADLVHK